MTEKMEKIIGWIETNLPGNIGQGLRNRFIRGPITTADEVADFVQTRAAYVAQTSLFGYLKERMGTSYMRYFQDDVFADSIRAAQIRAYRPCVSDLAIFATAHAAAGGGLSPQETAEFAKQCYFYAMYNSGAKDQPDPAEDIAAFAERADATVWRQAAIGENAFTVSPAGLIAAAPVIDEFKELDREIVMNSIRFRWRDIREQYRKRADCEAICEDFRKRENSDRFSAAAGSG